jgi:hypothetical protein
MDAKKSPQDYPPAAKKPATYEPPRLARWGSLRELTQGGGGRKREPGAGGRFTRF